MLARATSPGAGEEREVGAAREAKVERTLLRERDAEQPAGPQRPRSVATEGNPGPRWG